MEKLLKTLWEEDGIDPKRTRPREISGIKRILIVQYGSVHGIGFRSEPDDLLPGLRNSIVMRSLMSQDRRRVSQDCQGSCSQRSSEKRFKSGEQWEVLRRKEGAVIVGKDGFEKQLPLEEAGNFSVFEREKISLSIDDGSDSRKMSNTAGKSSSTTICELWSELMRPRSYSIRERLFATRQSSSRSGNSCHQSRQPGEKSTKSLSVCRSGRSARPNEAQFYVSMSRARFAMHVFTDSKVALREAVTRPSKRLSSWELLNLAEKNKALPAQLDRQRAKPKKQQQEIAYER